MNTRVLKSGRRAISVLLDGLDPGENVLRMAVGHVHSGPNSGILALTNRRILFIHAGVMFSQHVSVPLDTVTGVVVSKGAMYSTIKTTGAQSNVVVNSVNKNDAEDFASELRSQLSERTRSSTQVPNQAGTDVADQLERLAALRDRGVLTDLEFEAQKAKILGT